MRRFLFLLVSASSLLAAPAFAQEGGTVEGSDEPAVPESEKNHFGVGVRIGARAVPSVGLDLFYDIHPSLKETLGTSVGVEFIRRKGEVDLKVGASFEDYTGSEGVGDQFLQQGDEVLDLEFVQNSLQIFTLDLAVVGSSEITDWWHLTYGAGIGASILKGDLLRTDSFAPDAADPNTRQPCTAPGVPDANCIEFQVSERKSLNPDGSIPSIIPALDMLLGMRFDLSKNVSFRLEGGLRTISVYSGIGFDFIF